MKIEQALLDLGLTAKESRFYIAALELGQAPVREIARKARISRTNAYDVLARLAAQGLVSQAETGPSQNMVVIAERPEHLVDMIEHRRRLALDVMPELKSLHNQSRSTPRVRYYDGLDGIKNVLSETLACNDKQLFGILSMRDLYEVPGRQWMDELVRRRIEAGVFLYAIRSREKDLHNRWPDSFEDLRELRHPPDDRVFNMTSYIYDNKVAMISSRSEHFAMTIESEDFCLTQRHLFEVLWAASSPAKKISKRRRGKTPEKTSASHDAG
ncbi:MAG: TrmB family transcriptional regulator [Hyphomicrobiaceae bacterium]